MNLSVVILTRNEEKNILDCIESIDANGIIIVDDYSEDRTEEIIRNLKDQRIRFYKRKLNNDFSSQRNFALSLAQGEWVLFIDADERIPNELFREIKSIVAENTNTSGFLIKRIDVIWGKKLLHGESGNIKFVRLAKKNAGKWRGRVHETWDIKGEIGELKNSIIHYPHSSISEFLSEINFYSTIRARELYDQKTKVSALDIIIYPKIKFFINFFHKFGFLDGRSGFVYAAMMSLHSFLVRSKLWLLINKAS